MKSAQTKRTETIIRAAIIAVLALAAYKCTAQDFRISTAVGLVVFTESTNPDEICFSFGVMSGEIRAEHLDKTADTLPGKGNGAHSPQTIYGRKIKGPVKPVVSTRKHGKQIKKKISIYERIWRVLSRLAGGKAR